MEMRMEVRMEMRMEVQMEMRMEMRVEVKMGEITEMMETVARTMVELVKLAGMGLE